MAVRSGDGQRAVWREVELPSALVGQMMMPTQRKQVACEFSLCTNRPNRGWTRTSQDVAGLTTLIYIAGGRIASSYEYDLAGPLRSSTTPAVVLSNLEISITNLIEGGQLRLDISDEDVVVPESAIEFIESAALTLRTSREIYAARNTSGDR